LLEKFELGLRAINTFEVKHTFFNEFKA